VDSLEGALTEILSSTLIVGTLVKVEGTKDTKSNRTNMMGRTAWNFIIIPALTGLVNNALRTEAFFLREVHSVFSVPDLFALLGVQNQRAFLRFLSLRTLIERRSLDNGSFFDNRDVTGEQLPADLHGNQYGQRG
jgi:hypothetical protein